jgi:hypothetical protein
MAKLYSLNRGYPEELPFRIRLPNGFTRTDPSTFTKDELDLVGYVEVPDRPEVKENQLLSWNISIWDWEVFDLSPNEPVQEAP